jgi:hypothetical protein
VTADQGTGCPISFGCIPIKFGRVGETEGFRITASLFDEVINEARLTRTRRAH